MAGCDQLICKARHFKCCGSVDGWSSSLSCVRELLLAALLVAGPGVAQTAVQAAVLVLPYTYMIYY
jgi:hypothetical protein